MGFGTLTVLSVRTENVKGTLSDYDTIYMFSDYSTATIRYDHEFGMSYPVGPCSRLQTWAITSYLDSLD